MAGTEAYAPATRFAAVVAAFQQDERVTPPAAIGRASRFGASEQLRVGNKIFAMLVNERLVLKLPRQRVDALIAAGHGTRFDTGSGRLMKEWISIDPAQDVDWTALAHEALAFVGSSM